MEFIVITLIKLAIVMAVFMTTLAYLQWVERKVIAHIQLRMGPSRVGPHGLLQPLADVIKLITKEGVIPPHVNKLFYVLAPIIAVTFALLAISIIPFGDEIEIGGYRTWLQLTDINVGVLFILAASSMGVYGIALAGWASNNKYSLLGGLRSSAQMISYELPFALAVAAPLLLLNTLSLREIVQAQEGFYFGFLPRWTVFQGPVPQVLSCLIFLIAAFAETNRIPFDLPEAETELVAGFHTEYSSMKFAAFFMAEYANMITASSMLTILFLGGWQPPFPPALGSDLIAPAVFLVSAGLCFYHGLNPARRLDRYTLPVFGLVFLGLSAILGVPMLRRTLMPVFWFCAKTGVVLFLYIWIRATLPRFRYDQLMAFAWKFLFPLALVNLLITSLFVALS
ncbi:MAG: complex I subunit 1/NuoH family protein [Bryobacteraceae bacterium]